MLQRPHRFDAPCFAAASALLFSITLAGCGHETASDASTTTENQPLFRDVAEAAGLVHTHHKPILDEKLSNIMSWMASVGASVAVTDADGDGRQDLYFTSSRRGEPNRLYRNLGDGRFDEMEGTGIADMNGDLGASMDAIWGDVDNDGDADLYLVRWGHDGLYLNQGDGTFVDVTEKRFSQRDGSPGTQWANGNAAVFVDFDLDGRLDIYVGNYFAEVDLWNLESTRIMHDDFEVARNGGENYLYHQQEDGTFVEIAADLGINDPGWTLAVGVGDLDGDGIPDLYCADDFGPDQLYLGRPDGTFLDATEAAIGFDTKKGMNAEFGDFNNDGWLDIYVTNITTAEYLQEGNMLWQNLGPADGVPVRFADISLESGTYDGGWGWGAKFFDFDLDGDLDIVAANGFISAGEGSYWYDLASWTVTGEDAADAANWPAIGERSFSGYETERLFRNEGTMFTEQAAALGLSTDRDGRGIALIDYDDDGDLDVAIATQDHQPHLFHNDAVELFDRAHWLRVVPVVDPTTGTNRDGIGTRVTVRAGGRLFVRERDGGNGYSGQSDPRLQFGLGTIDAIDSVEVRWPDGGVQYVDEVAVDGELVVQQDPAQYVEPRHVLAPPAVSAQVAAAVAPTRAPRQELSDEALDNLLGDLEERLALGFDRPTANDYRHLAAEHGAHDRAIDFLTARVADGTSTRDAWRVELSLAYVDKIPSCGGLAAIVCKGRNAQLGIDALDAVLAEQPDSWLAIYSRGMNHLHWPKALRHSADAARDLERAVSLQAAADAPSDWHLRTWVALGQAYAKNGEVAKARDAWTRGLGVFPEAEELRTYLAITDDEAVREKVEDARSLEQPIDTDIRFYEALL
ncbi:MAG: FG-GAP-like repeat-containing protein [Acidobacteriota bacterium]